MTPSPPRLVVHTVRRVAYRVVWPVALALVSPVLEKNPQKVFAANAPVVFSVTRLVIAAFAVAMFRQLWTAGVAGWPEATLCLGLIFANHIASALEKLPAADVVAFGRAIVDRFGVGGTRTIGTLYPSVEEASTPERDPDDERA